MWVFWMSVEVGFIVTEDLKSLGSGWELKSSDTLTAVFINMTN